MIRYRKRPRTASKGPLTNEIKKNKTWRVKSLQKLSI